jgi:hypothetical protein
MTKMHGVNSVKDICVFKWSYYLYNYEQYALQNT